jgi:hypothetical protein
MTTTYLARVVRNQTHNRADLKARTGENQPGKCKTAVHRRRLDWAGLIAVIP